MEMPAFIVLGKFTQKGIENMKESPERLEAARKVEVGWRRDQGVLLYDGTVRFHCSMRGSRHRVDDEVSAHYRRCRSGQNRNTASYTSEQSRRHAQGTTVRKQFDILNLENSGQTPDP